MREDEFGSTIQETIRKVDELIGIAESRMKETDNLLASLGLKRGAGRRFLESDRLSPEQKAQAKAEVESFMKEVEEEIDAMVRQAKGTGAMTGGSTKARARKNYMRI